MAYKIVRMFFDTDVPAKVVKRGLTEDEAQAWCRNPETSSSTCMLPEGTRRTRRFGPWFDGYEEE